MVTKRIDQSFQRATVPGSTDPHLRLKILRRARLQSSQNILDPGDDTSDNFASSLEERSGTDGTPISDSETSSTEEEESDEDDSDIEDTLHKSYQDIPSKKEQNVERRQRKLTICLRHCRYELVKDICRRYDIIEVSEDSLWSIYWTDYSVSLERALAMKSFQTINHFPGMTEICRKDLLARNLNRMKRVFPVEYNIFPTTWCLPTDNNELQAYSSARQGKTYICKPEMGCQGRGIFLVKNIRDLNPFGRIICQVYIQKPFLIDGLKFDLRIYVLITNCDPLRVWVHKEGLARFATAKYHAPSQCNTENSYMHLTNYSVNKYSRDFVSDGDNGTKRKLSSVYKWMGDNGCNVRALEEEIDDVIIKTILSAHPIIKHHYKTCFPHHDTFSACFEILGFDVLIDHKLKPYVIEVNHSPSFHTDTQLDAEIKETVLNDTFNMLNTKHLRKVYNERVPFGVKSLEKKKNIRVGGDGDSHFSQYTYSEYLKEQFEWEEAHKGGYRLIYPSAVSEKYDKFLTHSLGSWYQDGLHSRARIRAHVDEINLKKQLDKADNKPRGMDCETSLEMLARETREILATKVELVEKLSQTSLLGRRPDTTCTGPHIRDVPEESSRPPSNSSGKRARPKTALTPNQLRMKLSLPYLTSELEEAERSAKSGTLSKGKKEDGGKSKKQSRTGSKARQSLKKRPGTVNSRLPPPSRGRQSSSIASQRKPDTRKRPETTINLTNTSEKLKIKSSGKNASEDSQQVEETIRQLRDSAKLKDVAVAVINELNKNNQNVTADKVKDTPVTLPMFAHDLKKGKVYLLKSSESLGVVTAVNSLEVVSNCAGDPGIANPINIFNPTDKDHIEEILVNSCEPNLPNVSLKTKDQISEKSLMKPALLAYGESRKSGSKPIKVSAITAELSRKRMAKFMHQSMLPVNPPNPRKSFVISHINSEEDCDRARTLVQRSILIRSLGIEQKAYQLLNKVGTLKKVDHEIFHRKHGMSLFNCLPNNNETGDTGIFKNSLLKSLTRNPFVKTPTDNKHLT